MSTGEFCGVFARSTKASCRARAGVVSVSQCNSVHCTPRSLHIPGIRLIPCPDKNLVCSTSPAHLERLREQLRKLLTNLDVAIRIPHIIRHDVLVVGKVFCPNSGFLYCNHRYIVGHLGIKVNRRILRQFCA